MRTRNRDRQRGVTLIELIVAITIVSIAATTILGTMGTVASRSADAMIQQQAIAIGQAYLDEILQRWVVDPNGTPPNTGRASWDLIDQYNGLSDTGARDSSTTRLRRSARITSAWPWFPVPRSAASPAPRYAGST